MPRGGGKKNAHAGMAWADGAEGNRTPDLCSAIAALSQLSYSPVSKGRKIRNGPGAGKRLKAGEW